MTLGRFIAEHLSLGTGILVAVPLYFLMGLVGGGW